MKHLLIPQLLALSLTIGLPAGAWAQATAPHRSPVPDDANWVDGFEQSGLGDDVTGLLTAANGDVYACGNFYGAGGNKNASRLARWDGTAWHQVGTQAFNRGVYCMLQTPNGDLIVGGSFYARPGNGIARWDGSTWHAYNGLGSGAGVFALAMLPTGDLIAAGNFLNASGNPAADRIARWDGTAWQPLGAGLNGFVSCLAVMPNGDVVAGGDFVNAGGDPAADRVARWDGTAWHALGTGVGGYVNAMAVSASGELVLGGDFIDVGGNPQADYAVRWDGTTWQPLCPGLAASVLGFRFTPSGDLLMGGCFYDAGGDPTADHVARRTGNVWRGIGGGLDPDPNRCLTPASTGVRAFALRPGGEVLFGGSFFGNGTLFSPNLARWTGTQWLPMGGNGHDNMTTDLLILSNGDALVSGTTFYGGMGLTQYVSSIARWDGTRWSQFGDRSIGDVHYLAQAPNGDVFAGGELYLTPGQQYTSIARWDGSQWVEVRPEVRGERLEGLAVASNGDVIATWERGFGSQTNRFVSRWNGTTWQQLGPDLAVRERVLNITTTPAGDIYIGGDFTNYGPGRVSGLARWDGSTWQTVGAGPGGSASSVVSAPNGHLWVGLVYSDVAHWDGTAWTRLPGIASASDRLSLALAPNGDLIASGNFVDAGGNPLADYIARWDGSAWQPLGSGLNGVGFARVKPNGDVVVFGTVGGFTATGDGSKLMHHFAVYRAPFLTATPAEEASPEATGLALWPNPARGLVRLEGPATVAAAVVVDGLGRTVRHVPLTSGRADLDLTGLPPGLYVVRAGSRARRLVVE